jgi:hypothetical protein
MNSSLIFVLLLVSIVMCAEIVKTWIKRKKPKQEENEELMETMSKIDVLEDRIKVLERIITENRYDLKKEIDSL